MANAALPGIIAGLLGLATGFVGGRGKMAAEERNRRLEEEAIRQYGGGETPNMSALPPVQPFTSKLMPGTQLATPQGQSYLTERPSAPSGGKRLPKGATLTIGEGGKKTATFREPSTLEEAQTSQIFSTIDYQNKLFQLQDDIQRANLAMEQAKAPLERNLLNEQINHAKAQVDTLKAMLQPNIDLIKAQTFAQYETGKAAGQRSVEESSIEEKRQLEIIKLKKELGSKFPDDFNKGYNIISSTFGDMTTGLIPESAGYDAAIQVYEKLLAMGDDTLSAATKSVVAGRNIATIPFVKKTDLDPDGKPILGPNEEEGYYVVLRTPEHLVPSYGHFVKLRLEKTPKIEQKTTVQKVK